MNKVNFREITLMNMILCFFVVFIHLISVTLINMGTDDIQRIIMFSINKMLCFSVPAFIFLSGFKLYNKYSIQPMKPKKFYRGRFYKIVLPYIAGVLVYYFYQAQIQTLNPANIPIYIMLGTLEAHFYYIIIAIQSYLIFPVLKKVFDRFPVFTLIFSAVCTVVCKQFWWYVPYMDRIIGGYMLYFVMGMFYSKYRIYENVKRIGIISGIMFAVMAVIHIRFSYVSAYGISTYPVGETMNILYCVSAITALYCLCVILKNENKVPYSFSKVISNSSFSIYLYHILIIHILNDYVYPGYEMLPMQQFAITSLVVILSVILYSYICFGISILRIRRRQERIAKERIRRERRVRLKYFHKFEFEDIKTALDEYMEEDDD